MSRELFSDIPVGDAGQRYGEFLQRFFPGYEVFFSVDGEVRIRPETACFAKYGRPTVTISFNDVENVHNVIEQNAGVREEKVKEPEAVSHLPHLLYGELEDVHIAASYEGLFRLPLSSFSFRLVLFRKKLKLESDLHNIFDKESILEHDLIRDMLCRIKLFFLLDSSFLGKRSQLSNLIFSFLFCLVSYFHTVEDPDPVCFKLYEEIILECISSVIMPYSLYVNRLKMEVGLLQALQGMGNHLNDNGLFDSARQIGSSIIKFYSDKEEWVCRNRQRKITLLVNCVCPAARVLVECALYGDHFLTAEKIKVAVDHLVRIVDVYFENRVELYQGTDASVWEFERVVLLLNQVAEFVLARFDSGFLALHGRVWSVYLKLQNFLVSLIQDNEFDRSELVVILSRALPFLLQIRGECCENNTHELELLRLFLGFREGDAANLRLFYKREGTVFLPKATVSNADVLHLLLASPNVGLVDIALNYLAEEYPDRLLEMLQVEPSFGQGVDCHKENKWIIFWKLLMDCQGDELCSQKLQMFIETLLSLHEKDRNTKNILLSIFAQFKEQLIAIKIQDMLSECIIKFLGVGDLNYAKEFFSYLCVLFRNHDGRVRLNPESNLVMFLHTADQKGKLRKWPFDVYISRSGEVVTKKQLCQLPLYKQMHNWFDSIRFSRAKRCLVLLSEHFLKRRDFDMPMDLATRILYQNNTRKISMQDLFSLLQVVCPNAQLVVSANGSAAPRIEIPMEDFMLAKNNNLLWGDGDISRHCREYHANMAQCLDESWGSFFSTLPSPEKVSSEVDNLLDLVKAYYGNGLFGRGSVAPDEQSITPPSSSSSTSPQG